MGSIRSGKSKILELIIDELLEKGVSKDHIISINFEDLSFDDIDDYKKLNAFSPIKDASSKYVLSLDKVDMSRNGITHVNIIDFLENKVDLFLL